MYYIFVGDLSLRLFNDVINPPRNKEYNMSETVLTIFEICVLIITGIVMTRKYSTLAVIIVLVGISHVGFGSDITVDPNDFEMDYYMPSVEEGKDINEELDYIHIFESEEMAVIPEVVMYDIEDAYEIGTIHEIKGEFPGLGKGTWNEVQIEGIEYFYGNDEFEEMDVMILYGYAIISDEYSLANGITVGMTEDEILKSYPNMAVIDFDNNYVYKEIIGHQGWNGTAYPSSYIGTDSDWDYNGEDYYWTNQFDYVMIANINDPHRGNSPVNLAVTHDKLPVYLALFIKDNVIKAITFYYPTAD